MWQSDKWIANKMAKFAFGVSVDEAIRGRALTELWLKRSHDKVHARNEAIKRLADTNEKVIDRERIALEKLGQKERTIKSKNSMIEGLKKENLYWIKECGQKQQAIVILEMRIGRMAIFSQSKEKEFKRQIKCLRENVRARNIRLEKLMSGEKISELVRSNFRAVNEINRQNRVIGKLEQGIRELKKTLADRMARGKIK